MNNLFSVIMLLITFFANTVSAEEPVAVKGVLVDDDNFCEKVKKIGISEDDPASSIYDKICDSEGEGQKYKGKGFIFVLKSRLLNPGSTESSLDFDFEQAQGRDYLTLYKLKFDINHKYSTADLGYGFKGRLDKKEPDQSSSDRRDEKVYLSYKWNLSKKWSIFLLEEAGRSGIKEIEFQSNSLLGGIREFLPNSEKSSLKLSLGCGRKLRRNKGEDLTRDAICRGRIKGHTEVGEYGNLSGVAWSNHELGSDSDGVSREGEIKYAHKLAGMGWKVAVKFEVDYDNELVKAYQQRILIGFENSDILNVMGNAAKKIKNRFRK